MRGDIGEAQDAFAFLRAPLPERQETAEPAVRLAVLRVAEKAQTILEIEPCADDEAEARLLGCKMRAHGTRQRVAVADRDGLEPQHFCLRHKLLRVRSSAQEGEVARHLQFGVTHRHSYAYA